MGREKYAVRLTSEERGQLERLIRAGRISARITARAGPHSAEDRRGVECARVAQALDVS